MHVGDVVVRAVLPPSMRPRGRTPRMLRLAAHPGGAQCAFNEAAGAYPADAMIRRALSSGRRPFNEAAGAYPADAAHFLTPLGQLLSLQ